LSLFKLLSAS